MNIIVMVYPANCGGSSRESLEEWVIMTFAIYTRLYQKFKHHWNPGDTCFPESLATAHDTTKNENN